jgi:hypothetical protein
MKETASFKEPGDIAVKKMLLQENFVSTWFYKMDNTLATYLHVILNCFITICMRNTVIEGNVTPVPLPPLEPAIPPFPFHPLYIPVIIFV